MMEMDSNTETSLFDSHEEQADIAGPTVSSLRKLVQDYFRLIDYTQRVNLDEGKSDTADSTAFNGEIRTLDDLPRLINYSSHAVIHNREKFLEAVHSQRWSLLSKMSSQQCLQNTPSIRTAHRVEKPFSLCGNHGDHETPLELFVAILKAGGDRPIVLDFLLRAGFDPNEFISDEGLQWPLLVYAVRLRRLHVVQALLDAGAHPDSLEPGPKRRTALGVAIAAGDVDMANLLILAGANFYEVESGTTALSLIVKLIKAYSSTPVQLSKLPTFSMAEVQDRRRSIDCELPSVPPPSPPAGFEIPTVPKSILFDAVIHSAATVGSHSSATTTTTSAQTLPLMQHSSPHTNSKWQHHSNSNNKEDERKTLVGLPSVDSLRRLYDLVAVHHARLSVRVTTLVRNWLVRAGLVQVGLVTPCQWVNAHQRSVSLTFNWPYPFHWSKPNCSRAAVPILLLVHGRLVPPACYDVWMDDDGPCLINTVCLDNRVVQKPLGRASFATTLFPLRFDQAHSGTAPANSRSQSHQISITFHSVTDCFVIRRTCVAAMVIAVTQDPAQPSHATGSTSFNGRSQLRPPSARPGLPTSGRSVLGSPPHVSRQRSVS